MAGNALVDYATEHALTFIVSGHCLHSSFYWKPGDLEDENDFLDPTGFGDLKLKLTGGASGAAVAVVTQQLRM